MKRTKPSVILYFHPVSHSHVVGRPLKVIDMLQELWGKDVTSKVFFVTTMWDEIEDPANGEEKLTELEDQGAILREYTLLKHLDTRDSSVQLLDSIVQWVKKQVEIQITEDVDRGVKDIIIALVGSTGTGKSSFVGKVSGDTGEGVGHSLTSCTSNIEATRCVIDGFNVTLVDTPGLNHTNKLEIEVPKMISDWLDITYETRPIPLAVLYFHRISDNRNPASTPIKILRDFQKLCGNNTASKVSLVTTMWDEVEDDVGEERLKELKENYWSMMISRGSTTFKYLNTQDSAMQLLGSIVEETIEQEELQLHEEISGMKLELQETTTGQELCSRLDKLEKRRNEVLRRIRVEGRTAEQETMRDLWKEFTQVKARLDSALNEARTLRTTRMRMKWIKIIFAKMMVHRWVDLRRRGRK
ncbi:P-loop containing nucleoside triphosphate hydrolase protein [Pisolithus marmoratus]|nr:P-loop containing nucleoside triphosphate hydrolase protein [Pisolithus marmoratus]